jgi:hypothetical protein
MDVRSAPGSESPELPASGGSCSVVIERWRLTSLAGFAQLGVGADRLPACAVICLPHCQVSRFCRLVGLATCLAVSARLPAEASRIEQMDRSRAGVGEHGPSSVWSGGIRTSTIATSGLCAVTAATRASASQLMVRPPLTLMV